jgi:signal transduction histidine kinase
MPARSVVEIAAATDWGGTALGPRERWPKSLAAIVDTMLGSRFAMWMAWGPDLTMLYNEDYARMTLGRKHPWAFGRSAREVWSEIWPDIGPRIERVMTTGRATWDDALLLFLERSGYPEETYHTFSYSPLADDDGSIAGMLCVVTEETDRVISERRLAAVRELASDLAKTTSERDVLGVIQARLRAEDRDMPFSLTYLFDDETGEAVLAASSGFGPDSPLAVDRLRDGDGRAPWSREGFLSTSVPVRIDLPPAPDGAPGPSHDGRWPSGAWDRPPTEAVIVPIAEHGRAARAGILVAGVNPYRRLDAAYHGFLELVSGQVASSVANARAYEMERRRAESLAELDRAKTEFFSNVSHEFRTPLTLLLGPTDDAIQAADDREPALSGEGLRTVHRNALRLLRLVNALLDFSRLEAGRIEARFEPTDLAALTGDLASSFRAALERAGVELVVDCPPLDEPVWVDRDQWEKVVLNLLSNAFKHTFEGRVTVRLGQAGPDIVLTVTDTGVGIDPAELPRVFERFHRVPGARARSHEGTGIGLSLVRSLVELHGGAIEAHSEVDRGTTFRVTIPAHREQRTAEAGPRPEADRDGTGGSRDWLPSAAWTEEAERWLGDGPDEGTNGVAASRTDGPGGARADTGDGATRGRVLVVDDNADMRAYLARLLGPLHDVDVAPDGEAALAAIAAHRPDLVLSDVMMPRVDGFELLRRLRADPRTQAIPVILLSARAGTEARIEGLDRGADDYLIKPFTARELVARVTSHLRLARERRQALELRDAFVGLVSHELRTPITTIYGAARILERSDVADEVRASLMADISAESETLRMLVEDLLALARADQGEVSVADEPVLVARVVERARAAEARRWPGHEIRIALAPNVPAAHGDAVYLEQVVRNLVSNAAKYSQPGTAIEIVVERSGDEVEVRVLDEGVGIQPGDRDKLFQMFYRSPATAQQVTGAGIGLYVCRKIVEAMGGRVWARPRDGGGSEFGFALRSDLEIDAAARTGPAEPLSA